MSEYLTVEVTAEDIRKGIVGRCSECPIALALSRATDRQMSFGLRGAWSSDNGELLFYDAPEEAIEFMFDFDCSRPVKPARFRFRRIS